MGTYRFIFALAALYNAAFGIWAGFFPRSFFDLFRLDQPRYPSIWACVGMVVGVYAVAYTYAAWKPERGALLIAVGLLGKLLGPIGWISAVSTGELPPRTFPLILANDLLWWFPFLFFFLRKLPARRALVAWIGGVVHILACLALLAVAGGTEKVADLSARRQWVAEHVTWWVFAWFLWVVASMSLLAFVFVWTEYLLQRGVRRIWAAAGCLVVGLGLLFDLAGESLNLTWPTEPGRTVAEFAWGARLYALLSPGIANGLYCAGGLVLSGLSWQTGWLRGWLGLFGFATWLVGFALTVMSLLGHGPGMMVSGAGVMVLFVPWSAVVGWKLFSARSSDRLAS